MQAIVDTLTVLNGVRHVGIYKNGDTLSTNFIAEQQLAMLDSSEVVAQVFLALEAVEKTHNEIFIGVNSGYLAGFRLHGGHIVLLLTDKKINFPMISMGIKSASERLKQQLEEALQTQVQQSQLAAMNVETTPANPIDEALIPILNQYVYILTEFLGPAASLVVEDAVDEWKGTYVQSRNNLTYLVALLESELETNKEKQLFRGRVDKIV